MEDLKEMVNLVTKRKAKKIEIIDLDNPSAEDNLYNKFFLAIQQEEIKDDEEAAALLYHTTAKDKKFLMLKSRLRDRLLNTVYFLDFNKKGDPQLKTIFYKVFKSFFAARVLVIEGARESAESLLKKNLNYAILFEFTEMIFQYTKLLRTLAVDSGNKKQFYQYSQMTDHYGECMLAENHAEFIFRSLSLQFAKTKSRTANKQQYMKKKLDEIKALSARFPDSFNIAMFFHRVELIYYQFRNDNESVLKTCDAMEKRLTVHPQFNSDQRLGEIYLLRMFIYLNLRRFKEGRENYFRSIQLLREGSINWFLVLENYFLLAMHTGNYEEASEVYDKAVSNDRFESLAETKLEQWRIYEAYLHFSKGGRNNFNLPKFLNSMPIFTQDKKGNYSTILIAQIIHLFRNNKEDEALDRVESLRKNVKRYMNNQNAIRTLLFVRLLKKMEHRYLRKEDFVRKYQPILDKLRHYAIDDPRNSESLEVIPYEQLWEQLLQTRR